MPKADAGVKEAFRALLPGEAGVVVKPMFGHAAAFVNGNMFSGTFGADMFVRLADSEQAELIAAGGRPFEPMAGRPMRGYIVLPPSWRRDEVGARRWIERALTFTAALPPKEAKKPKARR